VPAAANATRMANWPTVVATFVGNRGERPRPDRGMAMEGANKADSSQSIKRGRLSVHHGDPDPGRRPQPSSSGRFLSRQASRRP
jgi:hypothetical protein